MNNLGLFLIIISAFFHAWWSFLVKKSQNKIVFIWLMFTEALIIMSILYKIYFKRYGFIYSRMWLLAIIAATCYFLYQVFSGTAYMIEDMSLVYPLSMTGPVFIPIWAWFILRERISWIGFLGIALCVIGVYISPFPTIGLKELSKPFLHFKSKGLQYALFAGFISSIGAVINKLALTKVHVFPFTYAMVIIIVINFTLYVMQPKYRLEIGKEIKARKNTILLAGVVLTCSFLTFQTAISLTNISYASPARRISILFGVLLGTIILKEKYAKVRILASIIIILGVWLLKIA